MFKAARPNLTIRPAIASQTEFICQAVRVNEILAQSFVPANSATACGRIQEKRAGSVYSV
jgi:hypothetical protein